MSTGPLESRGFFVFLLMGFFFISLLPIIPHVTTYHDDERVYTNAAVRMLQTGDYFTPRYPAGSKIPDEQDFVPEGTPRFRKPILVYWILAASYKIFGINYEASRIPFLLAGCLVIWLTCMTSQALFQNREQAAVAALMILSNVQLINSSIRSHPDILQCLFISMSLYGFLNIMFNNRKTPLNYLLAYVGAGLAVATKGFLGLLPVAYAFAFCFSCKGLSVRPRDLIHWQGLLSGFLIASLWFAIIYLKHGDTAIQGFFTDQMGKRFSGSKIYMLVNLRTYGGALLRHFLPWSLMVLAVIFVNPQGAVQFFRRHKEKCLFILGWYLTFFVIFLFGNINRSRYLFSTYPLLCVLFSSFLVTSVTTNPSADRIMRTIFTVIMALGGFCGALAGLAGAFIDIRILVGGGALFATATVLYLLTARLGRISIALALGIYTAMIFSTGEILLRPVFRQSPAPQLVQCITHLGKEGKKAIALGLSDDHASQMRVLSGGRIEVQRVPDSAAEALNSASLIIVSENVKQKMNLNGFAVQECGYGYKKFKFKDFQEIISRGDKDVVFNRLKIRYYLGVKMNPPHSRS